MSSSVLADLVLILDGKIAFGGKLASALAGARRLHVYVFHQVSCRSSPQSLLQCRMAKREWRFV